MSLYELLNNNKKLETDYNYLKEYQSIKSKYEIEWKFLLKI